MVDCNGRVSEWNMGLQIGPRIGTIRSIYQTTLRCFYCESRTSINRSSEYFWLSRNWQSYSPCNAHCMPQAYIGSGIHIQTEALCEIYGWEILGLSTSHKQEKWAANNRWTTQIGNSQMGDVWYPWIGEGTFIKDTRLDLLLWQVSSVRAGENIQITEYSSGQVGETKV